MWKIFRHKEPQQPPAHTGCLNLRQHLLTICEDGEKKRHKSAGWSSMMQFPDQTGGAPGRGGTGMLWRSILAAAAILGLWVEPAAAGLYNPAEPDEGVVGASDYARFKAALDELRLIPAPQVPFEYPLRTRYRVGCAIDPRQVPRAWPVSERLALSAYFIRCQKFREAQQVLEPLIAQEPKNFLALSNLAAAYQQDRPDEAIAYLKRAIKAWPKWRDLSKAELDLVKQLRWD